MDNKEKSQEKRKTFINFYWPYLVVVFGPIVLYLIFALIYSLVTQNFFLFHPAVYGTVFALVVLFFVIRLGYFGFVVAALIFSIPILILLFGAVISFKKAKKAKAIAMLNNEGEA